MKGKKKKRKRKGKKDRIWGCELEWPLCKFIWRFFKNKNYNY